MEELAVEREPLEARKEELIERVGAAFREFNNELDFRKAMQMEAGASERKFRAVGREAEDLLRLQKALKTKEEEFKEELKFLAQGGGVMTKRGKSRLEDVMGCLEQAILAQRAETVEQIELKRLAN